MVVAVHRPAQKSLEPETLQKVPPHTLDFRKIGQGPNELRSFAQNSLEDRKITLASRPVDFLTSCLLRPNYSVSLVEDAVHTESFTSYGN